jgi:nitrite reductase/ring-hydroxylating ferredoxin subunit
VKLLALCRAEEIGEGNARSFIFGDGDSRRDVVVVRRQGGVRVYVNSCPHQGTPLETFPDKFLNEDGSLFVCSTHGARFRVEDGLCVSGPCEGKSLAVVPCEVREGVVFVQF